MARQSVAPQSNGKGVCCKARALQGVEKLCNVMALRRKVTYGIGLAKQRHSFVWFSKAEYRQSVVSLSIGKAKKGYAEQWQGGAWLSWVMARRGCAFHGNVWAKQGKAERRVGWAWPCVAKQRQHSTGIV